MTDQQPQAATAASSVKAERDVQVPCFFSLPPEIRTQILKHAYVLLPAWTEDGKLADTSNGAHKFNPEHADVKPQLQIASARHVSREFRAEAEDIYYKENAFRLHTYDDTLRGTYRMRAQDNVVTGLDFPLRHDFSLIRHLELAICLTTSEVLQPRGVQLEFPQLCSLKLRYVANELESGRLFSKRMQWTKFGPLNFLKMFYGWYKRYDLDRQIGCLAQLGTKLEIFAVEVWALYKVKLRQPVGGMTLGVVDTCKECVPVELPDKFLRRWKPRWQGGLTDEVLDAACLEEFWEEGTEV